MSENQYDMPDIDTQMMQAGEEVLAAGHTMHCLSQAMVAIAEDRPKDAIDKMEEALIVTAKGYIMDAELSQQIKNAYPKSEAPAEPTDEEWEYRLISSMKWLQKKIHDVNVANGFWPEDKSTRNKDQALLLMVSEIVECQDALRHGNPADNHIPAFSGEEAEMADVFIRGLDYCEGFDVPLATAILAKLKYNASRPYKHGKNF